jgi:glycerol-3-phosphate acyltransferase PlsX
MTWRVGLRLLSQGVGMLRKVSEFKDYGGAPLLGLQHLVLVANPDAGEMAFENAVKLATTCHRKGLLAETARALQALDATHESLPKASTSGGPA